MGGDVWRCVEMCGDVWRCVKMWRCVEMCTCQTPAQVNFDTCRRLTAAGAVSMPDTDVRPSSQGSIKLFRLPLTKEIHRAAYREYVVHYGPIVHLQLSADSSLLFSVGEDGTLLVFKLQVIQACERAVWLRSGAARWCRGRARQAGQCGASQSRARQCRAAQCRTRQGMVVQSRAWQGRAGQDRLRQSKSFTVPQWVWGSFHRTEVHLKAWHTCIASGRYSPAVPAARPAACLLKAVECMRHALLCHALHIELEP